VRRAAASLILALATVAPRAAADSTSDCIAASEDAQSLRDRRSLLAARDRLAVCSRDVCPAPIRFDCIQQRGEVDAAMPSVVLRAKDARAEDLVDVRVLCDGVVLATQEDGKALAVDPGTHTFRFEAQGVPPVERKLVIGEGEKNRLILAEMVSATSALRVSAAPTPAESVEPATLLWTPGLVVGAIGVAATIPMTVLWLSSTGDVHQMRDTCAPSAGGAGCSADRVDSDRTKLVIGDFFLGVAAAGIATGALLLFVHRAGSGKEHGAGPSWRLDASPMRSGGFISAATRF
jgi:hypothetical protein